MISQFIENLTCAANFYGNQLKSSPRAIAYLKQRGISGSAAARYKLGYAPTGAQSLRNIFNNYEADSLINCGLVVCNTDHHLYDRFRNRIIFPITDSDGDVIGFGGRVIDSNGPKYLNSPETELFHKGNVLFGLWQATASIRETKTVFVVEGYLDVVSLAQHGIQNVVATLGTATTENHIKILLSLTKNIIFCFDGDEAGRRAANHALDVCLEFITDSSITISFLFLPDNHDPDSYVRANNAAAFHLLAKNAVSLEKAFLLFAMNDISLEHAEGRANLIYRTTPRLQRLQEPTLRNRLVIDIAAYAQITIDELMNLSSLK